jgi:hypothetical protein
VHPDVECRYGIGEGSEKVMSKLSKSHYQKWPSDRSESRFFSQHLCVALAICRSNPATVPNRFRNPGHNQNTNKKACFIILERFAVFTTTGSNLPKQALVF